MNGQIETCQREPPGQLISFLQQWFKTWAMQKLAKGWIAEEIIQKNSLKYMWRNPHWQSFGLYKFESVIHTVKQPMTNFLSVCHSLTWLVEVPSLLWFLCNPKHWIFIFPLVAQFRKLYQNFTLQYIHCNNMVLNCKCHLWRWYRVASDFSNSNFRRI